MADILEKIDVQKIPPKNRHSIFFDKYDGLDEGQALMIINDHDPKPLQYQMAALYGSDSFSWNYVEDGPEVWKVYIEKFNN